MKICPKCNIEHKKSGIYCSRSCANSRIFSDDAKQKKSNASKKDWSISRDRRLASGILNASLVRKNNLLNLSERNLEKYNRLISRNWEFLSYSSKRWIVLYEQKDSCNRCKINSWLNQKISLEIDHRDGDRNNNARNNLEGLCPNCHSLTSTWRGKHRKKKIGLSDELIYNTYINAGNIKNTIVKLNLRSCGQTRNRILKAVERYIEFLARAQSGIAADC